MCVCACSVEIVNNESIHLDLTSFNDPLLKNSIQISVSLQRRVVKPQGLSGKTTTCEPRPRAKHDDDSRLHESRKGGGGGGGGRAKHIWLPHWSI